MEEGDRCQQCGTKESEWAADRFAYVAESHMCMGCYLIAAENENLRGSEGQSMDGVTVRLVANTPQKQAEYAAFAERMRNQSQE